MTERFVVYLKGVGCVTGEMGWTEAQEMLQAFQGEPVVLCQVTPYGHRMVK